MADPRPPQPPIPKPVYRVSWLTKMTEGQAYNMLYGKITGVVSGTEDVLAITNVVHDNLFDVLSACLSAEVTLDGMLGRYTTATNDWEAYSTGDPAVGVITGDALPIQDTFEIRRLTGLAGRDARGRLFFSGMAVTDTEFGQVKTVRDSALNALASFLRTNVVIGDRTIQWQHWSRKNSTLEPITGTVPIRRLVSTRGRAKKEKYFPI